MFLLKLYHKVLTKINQLIKYLYLFDVYYIDTEEELEDSSLDWSVYAKEHCGSEELDDNPFDRWLPYDEFEEIADKFIGLINDQIWHIKLKGSNEYITFIV